MSSPGASAAARSIRRASSRVRARGFSHSTCRPALRAATARSAWRLRWRAHVDDVDPEVEQCVQVGKRHGAVLVRQPLGLGEHRVRDGHQACSGHSGVRPGVHPGDHAGADDPDAQVGHQRRTGMVGTSVCRSGPKNEKTTRSSTAGVLDQVLAHGRIVRQQQLVGAGLSASNPDAGERPLARPHEDAVDARLAQAVGDTRRQHQPLPAVLVGVVEDPGLDGPGCR